MSGTSRCSDWQNKSRRRRKSGSSCLYWSARAWEAGCDGRAILDRVCATAPAALRPGGRLLLVHSGLCDSDTTLRRLSDAGLDARVSERARVPLGPVLRSRLRWLRESGLVGRNEASEELVVIRAEHP